MSVKLVVILIALSVNIAMATWSQWNFNRQGPMMYLEPELTKNDGYKIRQAQPLHNVLDQYRHLKNEDAKLAMNWDKLDYLGKLYESGRRR